MLRFIYERSATNFRDWSLAYSFIYSSSLSPSISLGLNYLADRAWSASYMERISITDLFPHSGLSSPLIKTRLCIIWSKKM